MIFLHNKLSIITDSRFIPIDIEIYKGNLNDSNILQQQFINIDTFIKNIKYFICDKGYCSSLIREYLKINNIRPIIPFNIRNTKNKYKIRKLSIDDKKKYKKRIRIEHIFGQLKINNKLGCRYEKYIKNYKGLIYLWFIKKICKL